MIRLIYTFLLLLASPILLYGLYKPKAGKPVFGKRWKEHFGITPKLASSDSPVWLHAVSVGEVIAAIPIIKAIKEKSPNQAIIVTTTTSTGAEQVERIAHLVEHRYMPIDFSFAVKGFLKAIQPQKLLIMETELWPNTLHTVAKFNIPIFVLNARLSHKSFVNYQKVRPLFNLLSKHISHTCCQNEDDAERFIKLGISPERISVTGSVKFDISISEEIIKSSQQLRQKLGLNRPVWIAASTHKGEDEQVLAAHKAVLQTHPNCLLILVPRHPERFDDVYALCQNEGLNTVQRTADRHLTEQSQVYLGDTMGELLTLCGASDICFMGGSLIGKKVGGHNVLEPIALGVPTITGPSYYNFTDIVTGLKSLHAIYIAEDSSKLANILNDWLCNPSASQTFSSKALDFLQQNSGAINKTINRLGYE